MESINAFEINRNLKSDSAKQPFYSSGYSETDSSATQALDINQDLETKSATQDLKINEDLELNYGTQVFGLNFHLENGSAALRSLGISENSETDSATEDHEPSDSDDAITVARGLIHPCSLSSLSPSPSSSSTASSSEECFLLGGHDIDDTPRGSTDSPLVSDNHDASTSLRVEPNQTFPIIVQGSTNLANGYLGETPGTRLDSSDSPTLAVGNSSSTYLKAEPTCTLSRIGQDNQNVDTRDMIETNPVSINKNLNNPPSPAITYTPKVTFQINPAEHKDLRTEIEARNEDFQELVGPQPKAAIPNHNIITPLQIQFPPTQTMERPNDSSSSSGYRIPSSVFARTKSNAPAEWSTASNESLFSIHMGNASFNRDQFFYQGKSGDLGMSSPFLDLSYTNKPTHSGQSSSTLDDDFRATEAKAAETMREVIRECAENRAKEESKPSPAAKARKASSSSISHQSEESTKSFAFPVLAGNGDRNASVKAGAVKQEAQSRAGKLKVTLVAADDTTKTSQATGQNQWLSYSCSSCCHSSCF